MRSGRFDLLPASAPRRRPPLAPLASPLCRCRFRVPDEAADGPGWRPGHPGPGGGPRPHGHLRRLGSVCLCSAGKRGRRTGALRRPGPGGVGPARFPRVLVPHPAGQGHSWQAARRGRRAPAEGSSAFLSGGSGPCILKVLTFVVGSPGEVSVSPSRDRHPGSGAGSRVGHCAGLGRGGERLCLLAQTPRAGSAGRPPEATATAGETQGLPRGSSVGGQGGASEVGGESPRERAFQGPGGVQPAERRSFPKHEIHPQAFGYGARPLSSDPVRGSGSRVGSLPVWLSLLL